MGWNLKEADDLDTHFVPTTQRLSEPCISRVKQKQYTHAEGRTEHSTNQHAEARAEKRNHCRNTNHRTEGSAPKKKAHSGGSGRFGGRLPPQEPTHVRQHGRTIELPLHVLHGPFLELSKNPPCHCERKRQQQTAKRYIEPLRFIPLQIIYRRWTLTQSRRH